MLIVSHNNEASQRSWRHKSSEQRETNRPETVESRLIEWWIWIYLTTITRHGTKIRSARRILIFQFFSSLHDFRRQERMHAHARSFYNLFFNLLSGRRQENKRLNRLYYYVLFQRQVDWNASRTFRCTIPQFIFQIQQVIYVQYRSTFTNRTRQYQSLTNYGLHQQFN